MIFAEGYDSECNAQTVSTKTPRCAILYKVWYKAERKCARCGADYPEEALFCMRCGTRLPEEMGAADSLGEPLSITREAPKPSAVN